MAQLPTPGGDAENWGTKLNNFLLVAHNPDGTLRDVAANLRNIEETYVPLTASGGVDVADARFSNSVVIGDNAHSRKLSLLSSATGGLNDSDSTSRVELHSYQKAQLNNNAQTNTGQAHYGEVIRINMEHQQAKGAIAFRENYLNAPEGPRTVAWLVAHGEANDSTPLNPVWHNHFSIELPDENGALQTSLEFPFAPFNAPNGFGMPLAQMYNRSTTQLIAANRGLVVENAAGVNKNIYFSSGSRGLGENQRWGLQADATAEAGSDTGTNLRINRYSDSGSYVDTPLFIRRSDGQVGIGTTTPSAKLDVVGTTELNGSVSIPTSNVSIGNATAQGGASLYIERSASAVGMLFRNTAAGGTVAANIVSQTQTSTSRAFQAGLQSDSVNRFSIESSGMIEWGAGGATGRDTNLYRSAANILATDDSFEITNATLGLILKSPGGTRYRVNVTNGGTLTATAL